MAIKDLLVAYNGNKDSQKALDFALQMAGKYDAKVSGINVYAHQKYDPQVRHWIPADVLKRVEEAETEASRSFEKTFRDQFGEKDKARIGDWHLEPGVPHAVIGRYARCYDILLTGEFSTVRNELRSLSPEELLSRSGKLLIVVPQKLKLRPFKEEAVVAWDGSRSAARALTDAMQILETKNKLDVVTVDTGDERAIRHMPDIINHLKRHGIDAKPVKLKAEPHGVAQAILDHCAKTNPDVLVMGAYGGGQLGSLLFGGVTEYVLENMNVPVLLSH